MSRWHRVDAAELWHWYGGAPLLLEVKHGGRATNTGSAPTGIKATTRMRRSGACLAERAEPRRLDLAGCTVAPASTSRLRVGASTTSSLSTQASRKARRPRDEVEPMAAKPQSMNWPPLMVSVEPVIQAASSAARNTTQRATSSASPKRPTGIWPTIDFITSSDTPDSRSVFT